MPSNKRRPPRRDATRKPSHLRLVPSSAVPDAVDLPSPPEAIAGIVASLLDPLSRVRNPLEAELLAGTVFAAIDPAAEGDDDDRLATLWMLLAEIIDYAAANPAPSTLGLLQLFSSLGPATTREAASAAAEATAEAGMVAPRWTATLGRPEVERCWIWGDIFGQQSSLGVLFRYGQRRHALAVLADHGLGGGVKDCWVAEGREALSARDQVGNLLASEPAARIDDVDVPTAAVWLAEALCRDVVPETAEQVEDVRRFGYLTRSRGERLLELAGLPVPDAMRVRHPSEIAAERDASQILRVKVTLRGSKPPIWRRLEVPSGMTLAEFHSVLQAAFDWRGLHLHCFETWRGRELVDRFEEGRLRREILGRAVAAADVRLVYTYDYGDDWQHVITVEDRHAPEDGVRYPRCTAGRRAAPLEGTGGMAEYRTLLEARALGEDPDPEVLDPAERHGWLPAWFDPERFDPAQVEARLERVSAPTASPTRLL